MKINKYPGLKKIPLWKWLLVIFLVFAMPLFFSLVRNNQLQRALQNSSPSSHYHGDLGR